MGNSPNEASAPNEASRAERGQCTTPNEPKEVVLTRVLRNLWRRSVEIRMM
jgi:hypothetical protein